eukprot:TRINITY_DN2129_c1_g1_i4.p1 TRINITY_DN2129_c1_g1~~TRINITY_DN2129_c1_g1_i4.p1  ORF type:complete len:188 (-),score=42.53 TRINITY_DN2129_c1_g1_i4:139-702(-)
MLAWMGGSRKKLKEAKNRRFGGTGLSPKDKKINKSRLTSPRKTAPRILKSTPVKSPTKSASNPFEKQCQAIAQGIDHMSNQAGPSNQVLNNRFDQFNNIENNGNNLHSKQFQLLMGVDESNQAEKKQENVQKQCTVKKCKQKVVELSPVFQGSLDLLVIQMPPETEIAELEEDSLLLSDADLELELE